MRKFLTIAAATAVLGAGVYAETAMARPLNSTIPFWVEVNRNQEASNLANSKGDARGVCRAVRNLDDLFTSNTWIVTQEDVPSNHVAEFERARAEIQGNKKKCMARGLLPRPSTAAPVARQRRGESLSDYGMSAWGVLTGNPFGLSDQQRHGPTGIPWQRRKANCERDGGQWQEGPQYCAHFQSAPTVHGSKMSGPRRSW